MRSRSGTGHVLWARKPAPISAPGRHRAARRSRRQRRPGCPIIVWSFPARAGICRCSKKPRTGLGYYSRWSPGGRWRRAPHADGADWRAGEPQTSRLSIEALRVALATGERRVTEIDLAPDGIASKSVIGSHLTIPTDGEGRIWLAAGQGRSSNAYFRRFIAIRRNSADTGSKAASR